MRELFPAFLYICCMNFSKDYYIVTKDYYIGGYDLRSNIDPEERDDIPCEGECNSTNHFSPREELKKRFQCLLLADIDWLKNQCKKKLRAANPRKFEGSTMFDFDVDDNDVEISAVANNRVPPAVKNSFNNNLYSDFLVVSKGEKGG